jgi:transposase
MTRLEPEARVTIKTLVSRGTSNAAVARLLGVSEGAVRYHVARMAAGAMDGRSAKQLKATTVAGAIKYWGEMHEDGPINLAALHDWLVAEHGYGGSLRSVQRFWAKHYPAPALRTRRRVETPAGAQAQADWAHFQGVIIGSEVKNLIAFKMVLSHSRKDAIVWSESKDMLAWLGCHTQAFRRLGGVPATVRIDNEKTAVVKGAGAWRVITKSYLRRRCAFMSTRARPARRNARARSSGGCVIGASPSIRRSIAGPISRTCSGGPTRSSWLGRTS